MSKSDIYKCEHCGNSTEDKYVTRGWITFEGSFTQHIKRPKKNRSAPVTVFLPAVHGGYDFCNMKCLANYIAKKECEDERKRVMK